VYPPLPLPTHEAGLVWRGGGEGERGRASTRERERARERAIEREIERERERVCVCVCVYPPLPIGAPPVSRTLSPAHKSGLVCVSAIALWARENKAALFRVCVHDVSIDLSIYKSTYAYTHINTLYIYIRIYTHIVYWGKMECALHTYI
jgi:hypothetical protein